MRRRPQGKKGSRNKPRGIKVFRSLLAISLLEAVLWSCVWLAAGPAVAASPSSTYLTRETDLFKSTNFQLHQLDSSLAGLPEPLDLRLAALHLHEERKCLQERLQESYADGTLSTKGRPAENRLEDLAPSKGGVPGPFVGISAIH